MIKQIPNFSNYKISDDGKLYKLDDSEIKPFKSNDYLQVCLLMMNIINIFTMFIKL